MSYCLLSERRFIHLAGDDAATFLQGLISNDVLKLKAGQAVYAALLSPQGKFLHDFFVILHDGSFYLDVDTSRLPDLLQRLNMYKLRSKVTITAEEKLRVAAAWGDFKPQDSKFSYADPRLSQLGMRIVGESLPEGGDDYERMRLELGVPDGARDMIFDKSLLLEFGFEDLHGVDFGKGCYIGQEVTARSKHRGQVRKFIYKVQSDRTLPPPGTPVLQDGAEVGEVRSSAGNIGIAILRMEATQKNTSLHAGDCILKATLPQWVRTIQ